MSQCLHFRFALIDEDARGYAEADNHADKHKPVCLIDEDARDYAEADNHADNHKPVEQWKKTQTASAARSMASMGSTDIASMSVKQIIQEIGELGGNAEGCYERQELEARLFNVRVAKKADGGDDARGTRKERCSKKIVDSVRGKSGRKLEVVNLEPWFFHAPHPALQPFYWFPLYLLTCNDSTNSLLMRLRSKDTTDIGYAPDLSVCCTSDGQTSRNLLSSSRFLLLIDTTRDK